MSKNFTPRNMRKRYRNSGVGDSEKKKAFRRVASTSKRFIRQPASSLEKTGPLNAAYIVWCAAADRGALRRGK